MKRECLPLGQNIFITEFSKVKKISNPYIKNRLSSNYITFFNFCRGDSHGWEALRNVQHP